MNITGLLTCSQSAYKSTIPLVRVARLFWGCVHAPNNPATETRHSLSTMEDKRQHRNHNEIIHLTSLLNAYNRNWSTCTSGFGGGAQNFRFRSTIRVNKHFAANQPGSLKGPKR